jgi:hypothetical protein
MNRYTIEHNGKRFTVEAATPDEALSFVQAQDLPPVEPPPGAISHGGDGRSYMAGDPSIGVNRSASSIGTPEGDRANAEQMEALRQRGDGRTIGALGRAVLPYAVGLGQGFGDEAIAAATAGVQRLTGAGSPDNYAVNQGILQQELDRERSENKWRAGLSEVAGSLTSAIPAAAAGLTAARFVPQTASGIKGLAMRGAALGADATVLGSVYGAGSANQGERIFGSEDSSLDGAVGGGMLGLATGIATPLITSGIGAGAKALRLTSRAQRTKDQLANLLQRSRQTPQQIGGLLDDAAREGQNMYTVGDAMGRTGREELSRLSRTASDTGDDVFRALETRQLDAKRRLGGNFDEAATGRQGYTSSMAERDILASRDALANQQYSAARASAGAVDPSAAIRQADDFLRPGSAGQIIPQSGIADDSIESAVRRARSYLTDGQSILTDFRAASRAKQELDNMISAAQTKGQRPIVVELTKVRNALDDALSDASPDYARARDSFRTASQAADAIDQGRGFVGTSRSEDTLDAFNSMQPNQQAGARVGYGSRSVENIRKGSPTGDPTLSVRGVNARPEIDRILGPRVNRQIDREYDMFRTYQRTAGGTMTAQNLAEDSAGVTGLPGMLRDAAGFNLGGLLRSGLSAGAAALRGESEPVRQMLAKALLSNNTDELARMMAERGMSQRNIDALARALLTSGAVSTTSSQGQ